MSNRTANEIVAGGYDSRICHIMSVMRIDIADAKAPLSEFLDRLPVGETIVICDRAVPIAELLRLPARSAGLRKFGGYKDQIRIHPDFFRALPDDELEAWRGGSG